MFIAYTKILKITKYIHRVFTNYYIPARGTGIMVYPNMNQILIAWTADEHVYTQKNAEWYWTVGIIGATVAALAFIFSNIMFGVFVVVATIALCIVSSKPPRRIDYSINDRGIMIDDRLYTFLSMKAFWIEHNHGKTADSTSFVGTDSETGEQVETGNFVYNKPAILIRSSRPVMPYIHIPIEEVDPEEIRDILLKYIPERQMSESQFHKIFEQFGF